MFHRILTLVVTREIDVRRMRKALRRLAALAGLPPDREKELTAAASEIARNACLHAGGGTVDIQVDNGHADQAIRVRVRDRGPGIPGVTGNHLGHAGSTPPLGPGLEKARTLVDEMTVQSEPGMGACVVLRKRLPPGAPKVTARVTARWTIELTRRVTLHALARTHRRSLALRHGFAAVRRREGALRRARDTAEADRRARNALLAHLLREIRSPLDAIVDLSDRALETDSPREQRDALRSVGDTARSLLDFLDATSERVLLGTSEAASATAPTAEGAAAAAATVDLDAALRRLEGNEQLLRDLIRFFLDDHGQLLAKIEHALAVRRPDDLARAVHRLKGLVANFDAPQAVLAALRLEAIAREGNLNGAEAALAALREETARVRLALEGPVPLSPGAGGPGSGSGP